MNNKYQNILMVICVVSMILCSIYIWDHDRKLPKEPDYVYEPFKSEDVHFWTRGGGNILGPPKNIE